MREPVDFSEREAIYGAMPKGHYAYLSGRAIQVLNMQADRYGIPLRGATVNLGAILTWFHDFLAANRTQLATADDGDVMLVGGSEKSPALEKYREERAKLTRMERFRQEGKFIDRDQAHDALGRIAGVLRRAGEVLQRVYGADAQQILDDALDAAERDIDRVFNATTTTEEHGEWEQQQKPKAKAKAKPKTKTRRRSTKKRRKQAAKKPR